MMLAWTSYISQVPIYRFEYGFSALSFILTFGPAFCFALLMGVRPGYSFLLALAVCVGFWAQFVLDIRAVSQINSVPVILLLALFFSRIEFNRDSIALGERFLLAITIVALTFLYPEILPMTALAVAIYFGACFFWKQCSLRTTAWHLLSIAIVVLGIVPVASFLGRFFTHQMIYAATGQNTWHEAYFAWLYSNTLTGLWGLSHLSYDRPILLQTIMVLIGLILSLLLILAVISEVLLMGKRKQILPATSIGISFVLAAIIQFLYLFFQDQLWAAGKGLSYGYPFIMIATGAYGLTMCKERTFRWHVTLQRITKSVIVVWLVIQCGLGISRIGYAYAGSDYRNYIIGHSQYRRHDWNLVSFSKVFDEEKATSVWISAGTPWVSEYLGFVFGWDMNVLNLDGVRGRSNVSKMSQTRFELPQYLILSRDSYQNFDEIAPFVAAQNSELMLVRVSPKLLHDEFLALGDYYFDASTFRVYVRPDFTISGVSGGWITKDGIILSIPRDVAVRASGVELEGTSNFKWVSPDLKVYAGVIDSAFPNINLDTRMTVSGDHYLIQCSLPEKTAGNSSIDIRITFSEYFVPRDLGINEDTRKLVIMAPQTRKVVLK